jgi:hypothetical protein
MSVLGVAGVIDPFEEVLESIWVAQGKPDGEIQGFYGRRFPGEGRGDSGFGHVTTQLLPARSRRVLSRHAYDNYPCDQEPNLTHHFFGLSQDGFSHVHPGESGHQYNPADPNMVD